MITADDVHKWAKKIGPKTAFKKLMSVDLDHSMAYKLTIGKYKHKLGKFYQEAIKRAMKNDRKIME